MVNVQFLAYPSREPIISCRVASGCKLKDLRTTLRARLASDVTQQDKDFTRWYWKLEEAGSNKFIQITNEEDTLDSLGDGRVTEIFLESAIRPRMTLIGPNSPIVGMKRERDEDESCIDNSLLPLMDYPKSELARMCLDAMKRVGEATARATESERKVSEMALASAASLKTISAALQRAEELETLYTEAKSALALAQKKLIESAPAAALMEQPDEPLMALWSVLHDARLEGPSAAMAVISDPRCGLKLRANNEIRDAFVCNRGKALTVASPLAMAVIANRIDVVKSIVQVARVAGNHIPKLLNIHSTLFPAARSGHYEILSYLLRLGANPDGTGSNNTPLQVASENGEIGCMELLLEANANVNATDRDGWTALHFAAHFNQLEAAKVLRNANAHPTIRCQEGLTPYDHARSQNCSNALIALLDFDDDNDDDDSSQENECSCDDDDDGHNGEFYQYEDDEDQEASGSEERSNSNSSDDSDDY